MCNSISGSCLRFCDQLSSLENAWFLNYVFVVHSRVTKSSHLIHAFQFHISLVEEIVFCSFARIPQGMLRLFESVASPYPSYFPYTRLWKLIFAELTFLTYVLFLWKFCFLPENLHLLLRRIQRATPFLLHRLVFSRCMFPRTLPLLSIYTQQDGCRKLYQTRFRPIEIHIKCIYGNQYAPIHLIMSLTLPGFHDHDGTAKQYRLAHSIFPSMK